MTKLSSLRIAAIAAAAALCGTAAVAEQTIGIQPSGTAASATARVEIRVTVPKIVILRVGAADANPATVDFTYAVGALGNGNSQDYSGGAVPPTLATTTSPADVTVQAWSNAGANLTCGTGALAGTTAFAAGASTTAPGTADIATTSVGANAPAHPGATLAACGATTALTARTNYTGQFRYTSNVPVASLNPGTYGVLVTYTATAP